MRDPNCIFCKICAGETDTKFIYEDDLVVVFPDLYPKAKTHVLITAKKHIPSLNDLDESQDLALMGHMITLLPKIAHELGLKGFVLCSQN